MNKYIISMISGILGSTPAMAQAEKSPAFVAPERGFISSTPADTWEHGLISGNGSIGANVMSRPLQETVIFTHERLFLPQGPPHMPPDNAARLFEIRSLIDRGLYKQATNLQFDLSKQEGFMYPDPFVPAFDLNIGMNTGKDIKDYVRSVDFLTGETTVHWADSHGVYERRLFVSRADGVAVMLITGPGQGAVDCTLALSPRQVDEKLGARTHKQSDEVFKEHVSNIKTHAEKSCLTYKNTFSKAYPGSIHALEGLASVVTKGGNTAAQGDSLVVTGADQVLVLVDIRMIYDPAVSQLEDSAKHLAAMGTDYSALLKRHAAIHGDLFKRVRLDLGGGADRQLTTEELQAKSTNTQLNMALIEKEFDAGRYNIISATGQLPPNLQGVWGGTYVPSWASDYTHNGNVPSAIASTLMGNTPELMLAYTSYIESIVPWLEINAKNMFGARGVVLPSRSTTNGFNNALANDFAGGFWVGGAAWAAHFFYDYYEYTGDRKFLAEHALPYMQKAGLFFEDYLYVGADGRYVFSPTQSPENFPKNTGSQGTFNATMDIAAAKQLFNNLIKGSEILGTNRDKIVLWKSMLAKMPDYQISDEGFVKEWATPKLTDDLNHRHSSQLYALYDGIPDEIANNPKLKDAFKHMIELKLQRHWSGNTIGFMSFGLVQLGQASTSLGEPDLAYQCLIPLVNRYWLSNLASTHNHKSLFNMDISGGMPAVIIKMLAASEPGHLKLLPAVPTAWPTGEISGVACRGQITLTHLAWNKGLINVRLLSAIDQTIRLEAAGKTQQVTLTAGKEVALEIHTP
ncbi:MAG: glycoside hydrolase N-terminal domain-containing protein [Verrucomicrobiota bacterium]